MKNKELIELKKINKNLKEINKNIDMLYNAIAAVSAIFIIVILLYFIANHLI